MGELHKKLERIDLQTKLVVHSEIDNEPTYFDVCVVSLQKGTPPRFDGIVGFAGGKRITGLAVH